jgi:hypothetical protein
VLSSAATCGAGRAYRPAPIAPAQARLVIAIVEPTGIETAEVTGNVQETMTGWYDLNGRRLQGQPTAKGLYIHQGKKVLK